VHTGVECVTLLLFVGRVLVLSEKQCINGYKSSGVVLWGYNDVTVCIWFLVLCVHGVDVYVVLGVMLLCVLGVGGSDVMNDVVYCMGGML